MKNAVSFKPDEKTARILSTFEEKGYNKSEIIRKALQFYDEFYFDEETWKLLARLQKKTNLRNRKAVLVIGLKTLEEILKFETR
jgi:Arc/MetJ-type ribon-helix-helix transcriptional regulator